MNPTARYNGKFGGVTRILLRWASFALVLAGVIAVGYAGYDVLNSQAYQTIELRKFERNPPLTEPHLLNFGDVIGEIQIPRLEVKAVIVQGDTPELLDRAVGHIPQTALPGEWGNVALAGHRDRLFRPLRQIRQGDTILLVTSRGSFAYEVESAFVVPSTEVGVLQSSSANELTLITCYPFDYVGHAPNRFIVRGRGVCLIEEIIAVVSRNVGAGACPGKSRNGRRVSFGLRRDHKTANRALREGNFAFLRRF